MLQEFSDAKYVSWLKKKFGKRRFRVMWRKKKKSQWNNRFFDTSLGCFMFMQWRWALAQGIILVDVEPQTVQIAEDHGNQRANHTNPVQHARDKPLLLGFITWTETSLVFCLPLNHCNHNTWQQSLHPSHYSSGEQALLSITTIQLVPAGATALILEYTVVFEST